MESTYTGRKEIRRNGQDHSAEVTIRAWPSQTPTAVTLSAEVLKILRSVFQEDFEYQRHNVFAAVEIQIRSANVAGDFPLAGAMSFQVEVVNIGVSGNAGREVSGFLLTVASMDAMGKYLVAWEECQDDERDGGANAREV